MVSASESDYIIQVSEIQELEKIDEGSFGVVYKGLMEGYIEIAIKKLYNQALSQKAKKDLEQEIAITQKMRHPNIITVYGYCVSPLQLIMEYLPQNLFSLLQNDQELSWELRYKISLDIVLGLLYIHKKKIIHRDLKSNNILLDKDLKAKITDFGLSRIRTESFSKNTQKQEGTLRWMAPELMDIKPKYSFESDIFALGVIFWEIAAREVPFKEAQDRFIEKGIIEGKREEIPTDCPQEYKLLISECWKQNPQERSKLKEVQLQLQDLIKAIPALSVKEIPANQKISSNQPKLNPQEENKTKPIVEKMFQINYDKSQDQVFEGHQNGVLSVVFSSDMKWLVSGSHDGTIKVWEFQTGQLMRTLGHSDTVTKVLLTSDNGFIISASGDSQIMIWKFDSGECVQTLSGHVEWLETLALSADNKFLVSGGKDYTIRKWKISN